MYVNKVIQSLVLVGILLWLVYCLIDSEYLIMTPGLLIPIGAIQYISGIVLVFQGYGRYRMYLILATTDLFMLLLGVLASLVPGLPIAAMIVGMFLAVYYWILSFTNQKDLPL